MHFPSLIVTVVLTVLIGSNAVNHLEEESSTQIYFANGADGVRAFSLNTSEATLLTTEPTVGIAYDSRQNKLYGCANETIWKSNVDGSGLHTLLNTNEYGTFRGISIEPLTRNIYISAGRTNYNSYYILVCSISSADGFACAPIQRTFRGLVGNFAFDPANRNLYFPMGPIGGEGYFYYAIMRMGLDGSELTPMYTTWNGQPTGVTIGLNTSKLYWADYSSHSIMFSDLEGQDFRTIVQLKDDLNPWGIALANGRLYWTTTFSLMSSEANGSDIRTHFNSTTNLYHLIVGGEGKKTKSD